MNKPFTSHHNLPCLHADVRLVLGKVHMHSLSATSRDYEQAIHIAPQLPLFARRCAQIFDRHAYVAADVPRCWDDWGCECGHPLNGRYVCEEGMRLALIDAHRKLHGSVMEEMSETHNSRGDYEDDPVPMIYFGTFLEFAISDEISKSFDGEWKYE